MDRLSWSDIADNRGKIEQVYRVRKASKPLVAGLIPSEASVLDVGAGRGALLKHLTARSFRGKYHCQDIDPNRKVDYRSLEEAKSKFDVVTVLDVFEHLELSEAIRYLERIRSILNDGGWLIISVPDPSHPTWIREDITHVQHYPMNDLAALLHVLGYRSINVWRILDFAEPEHYPLLARKLLRCVVTLSQNLFSRLLAINLESRTFVMTSRYYH